MTQNNSLFVWKTSNYSCWRSNLRNDMKQVTNLESLGFTRERIAKLLGVFPEVVLCDIDFSRFFDVAFNPHISSIVHFVVDRVAKLVLFLSVAETDDSPAPTLRSSLPSPLLPLSLILGNSLPNSCVTDGYWFSSISHLFTMFTKWLHYLFWCILTIDHSRVMHWQPAAFTVLMNWLFDRFVSRQKASQTY